jgi:cephalosporin-C deacetylase
MSGSVPERPPGVPVPPAASSPAPAAAPAEPDTTPEKIPTGERLETVAPPPAPAGFDDFWRATFAAAQAVPRAVTHEDIPPPPGLRDHRVSVVYFDGFGGFRQGAWLAIPRARAVHGLVIGHGYGGRGEPEPVIAADTAAIMPCAPGFHLSARADLPAEAMTHVVRGIAHRDTYLIRFCVAGIWAAADVLLALCPEIADRLGYLGTSFGGGLGALALPWDARFRRAVLDVPTFGHHPWRLRVPCAGSGEAVRLWHRDHPEVVDVLGFYDAAVAGTRIRVPTMVAPARRDGTVPPVGQWAIANAIPGAVIHPRRCGHLAWSGEPAEVARVMAAAEAFLHAG